MSENSTAVIEGRTPILDRESAKAFSRENINKQWNLIIEAAKRDLIAKPEIRRVLLQFCATPVSERLPDQFVVSLSSIDPRVVDLAQRYKSGIDAFLKLPPVPDEQIKPDLKMTPRYVPLAVRIDDWKEYLKMKEEDIQKSVIEFLKNNNEGITEEERKMIGIRYRYARDIKLLALGAEIIEHGGVPNEKREIILPSGTRMVIDVDNDEERLDLLSPHLWQKRRQLKDRVYEIEINNRKYILKERKTSRHTDTTKYEHGHKPGNTSLGEFAIAKKLNEQGIVEQGRIRVSWEKPIGLVEYPDGFQFAVFTFEEGIMDDAEIHKKLYKAILSRRGEFEEEFQRVATLAQQYTNDPRIIHYNKSLVSRFRSVLKPLGIGERLSFGEFASVKTDVMIKEASRLSDNIKTKNGYDDVDSNQYAFRINTNDTVQLEVVGLDFEYSSPTSKSKEEIEEMLRRFGKPDKQDVEISFMNSGSNFTEIQKAAYLALLDKKDDV